MSLTLRIEHTDGTTDELQIVGPDSIANSNTPSLASIETEGKIAPRPDEPIDRATATVYEDAWNAVKADIDDTNDEFYIDESGVTTPIFGGRLHDTESRDTLRSVILHGPKRDALDAKPSGGNEVYPAQSDDSIVNNELLPRMSTVSAGTVNQQTASIAFSESQAAPGKSLTKLAEATGAEVRYQPTGSPWELDYIGSLGSDRTGETLSPDNGTLLAEPRVRNKVRENVTHIRVLGAQSGTAQIEAEAVASSFDSSTDRPVYRQKVDKDIQQQSRADDLATRLVNEYDGDPEYLEVEAEIASSVSPSLGDEFTVKIPSKNINTTLRIMSLRRILDRAGERFRALLSNRKLTRDVRGEQQTRSVDEFRAGNAGQYFFNSERVSFDPIASGEPREFAIRYPTDVVGNFSATLIVKSRAYRGRVESAGHSHSVTTSDHNHSVTINDHTHDVEIEAPNHAQDATLTGTLTDTEETSNPNNEASSVPDHTHTFGIGANVFSSSTITKTSSSGGGETVTSSDGGGETTTTDTESDLAPGINTFTGETVSNVDVILNGTTIASGLSSPVDETIDITGQLSGGDNTVKITSDTLGEIEAIWTFEGIKNAT